MVEIRIVQNAFAHGVGDIGATLADDIRVGVVIEEIAVVLQFGLQFSIAIDIQLQGFIVEIDIALTEQVGNPLKRYVGRDDGIQVALLVVERMREGGHHLLAATAIVVRLAPVVLLQQFGYLIPVHIVVLVVGRTQLFGLDIVVDAPVGIRRELLALLLVVVGFERHC